MSWVRHHGIPWEPRVVFLLLPFPTLTIFSLFLPWFLSPLSPGPYVGFVKYLISLEWNLVGSTSDHSQGNFISSEKHWLSLNPTLALMSRKHSNPKQFFWDTPLPKMFSKSTLPGEKQGKLYFSKHRNKVCDECEQLQVSRNSTVALQIPSQRLVVFNNTDASLCTCCYTLCLMTVPQYFHCKA